MQMARESLQMADESTGLQRSIGRYDLAALVINGVVGAGIFGLPAQAFALTGVWSLLAFVLCAGLATLIALCFAEVGSRFRETGGPYLYARKGLGTVPGFLTGWIWFLARVAAYAANLHLMINYLAFVFPALQDAAIHSAAVIAVTVALTALNIRGVRYSTVASNIFAVTKLGILFFFVGAGIFFLDPAAFRITAPPPPDGLGTAILLLVYAFTGFELAAVPAGEVKDPRRDLPRALLAAMGVIAVLYVGIQVVCVGTLPGLAQSTRPLADAANRFAGAPGAMVIVVGAIFSILGNLNLQILACSRIPFAMAAQGDLPAFLAALHPRRHTPFAALIVTAAVGLGLALSQSFLAAVTISSMARLIAYGATAVALLRFRVQPAAPAALFQVPFAPASVWLTLALMLWLLTRVKAVEIFQTIGAILAGLALFAIAQGRKRI
jgi:APA family basic amino acid/polyamine antiporter